MDGAGTISGRWSLAAGRAAVKGCRICHGPTLPGMRLCTQCKAALKRARQETVSEAIPPSSARAGPSRPSRSSNIAPMANVVPRRGLNPGGARATAVVLSIVAATAVGYAALRFARAVPATFPEPAPVAVPSLAPSDAAPPPRVETAAPVVTTREVLTPFVPPASASRIVRPAVAKRAPEPPPPALPPEPPAAARFANATEPPAPPPAVVPPPRPVPRPDRWQLMADAIAQCGREGFFAGVVCEQRIRLQYCEGYWGQAAQCPSGIPNDHGQ